MNTPEPEFKHYEDRVETEGALYVRITSPNGTELGRGRVKSAHNYFNWNGPDWYVEFYDDRYGYQYIKQSSDVAFHQAQFEFYRV